MNNGGEAADQMVREALQFSEVAIKLTALGFKNSLAIALAYAKENPKVRGKTSLDRLLREGKEMKIIPLQTKDLAQFKAYAKQYGVLFASIKDKGAQGEKIDIMFKAEDVSKLNRIYEQLGYTVPKKISADRKNAETRCPACRAPAGRRSDACRPAKPPATPAFGRPARHRGRSSFWLSNPQCSYAHTFSVPPFGSH